MQNQIANVNYYWSDETTDERETDIFSRSSVEWTHQFDAVNERNILFHLKFKLATENALDLPQKNLRGKCWSPRSTIFTNGLILCYVHTIDAQKPLNHNKVETWEKYKTCLTILKGIFLLKLAEKSSNIVAITHSIS